MRERRNWTVRFTQIKNVCCSSVKKLLLIFTAEIIAVKRPKLFLVWMQFPYDLTETIKGWA